jgi:hypothetical protein
MAVNVYWRTLLLYVILSSGLHAQQFTATPSTSFPLDANGWLVPATSQAAPCTGAAGDACTHYIYADTAIGNAICAATTTQAITGGSGGNVCNNLVLAISKLRAGSQDWLLVNKGTTWQSGTPATVTSGFGNLSIAGKSCTQPIVITTYGTGARPLIKIANNDIQGSGMSIGNGATSGNNVFVSGFEFYAYQRDPSQPGNYVAATAAHGVGAFNVGISPQLTCFTIQDNKCNYLDGCPTMSWGAIPLAASNITLWRNVIVNNYSPTSNNVSGTYVQAVNNYVSHENFYDTNGWNPLETAFASVTYTNASPSVFTWPSTPFFINNLADGNFYFIECTTTANGITANTPLYIKNLSGSTFNVSTSNTGSPLLATSGSGTITCWWPQPGPNFLNHNKYINGSSVYFSTLIPGSTYGDISINDASGDQWRQGGPQINTLTALSGYGNQLGAPEIGGAAGFATNHNVLTEMIAGGTPNAAVGRTGAGLASLQNNQMTFAVFCADGSGYNNTATCLTVGDQVCTTFSNTSLSGLGTISGAPIKICYTVAMGDGLAAISTGLTAAINANATLSDSGACGVYSSSTYGMCAVANFGTSGVTQFKFIGPLTGQVIVTGSTTGTELVYTALPGTLSPYQVYDNLVFAYSDPTFGGQSNATPLAAIGLAGNDVAGTDIQNNVACNWKTAIYQNKGIEAVQGLTSGTGGISRIQGDSSWLQIAGQGPVFLSGNTPTALNGQHYARWLDSFDIEIVDVPYPGPLTIAGTVTAFPNPNIVPNANNKFGSGSGTNDCAALGFGSVIAQTATGSITGTALTFSATLGTVAIGQQIKGVGVTDGTFITAGSGSSWTVNNSQTVGSEAMQANAATLGAFLQDPAIGLGGSCSTPNGCTDQDFINLEKLQSKDNWNPNLRACVVNDWMRKKFGMTQVGC